MNSQRVWLIPLLVWAGLTVATAKLSAQSPPAPPAYDTAMGMATQGQAPYGPSGPHPGPDGAAMQGPSPYGTPLQGPSPHGPPMPGQGFHEPPMPGQGFHGPPMPGHGFHGPPMPGQGFHGSPMPGPGPYGPPMHGPHGPPAGHPNPHAAASFAGQPQYPQPQYPMPPMAMHPQDEGLHYEDAGWCDFCSGYGCQHCVGYEEEGFLLSLLRRIGPYGEGGCCAPRWFDLSLEGLYLTRDRVSRRQDFTSDGILGPIVLSTDDLDLEEALGMRFTAALQLFAASNLEFTYMGLFNWADSEAVFSEERELFSVFSQFGAVPFLGFAETDQAFRHSIAYSSSFDSFELNWRKRWTGPNCRMQGSWLMGVRYFKLDEDFLHRTQTDVGQMDYLVGTRNSMTGFQAGMDFWACVIPGLQVGADIKTGIYGNRADQGTTITATTIDPTVRERAAAERASFLGEANLQSIYRLTPQWTLRAGYHLLYVDGVALAPDNFNPEPPFAPFPPRDVRIDSRGDVFYHGASAGLEWMW